MKRFCADGEAVVESYIRIYVIEKYIHINSGSQLLLRYYLYLCADGIEAVEPKIQRHCPRLLHLVLIVFKHDKLPLRPPTRRNVPVFGRG